MKNKETKSVERIAQIKLKIRQIKLPKKPRRPPCPKKPVLPEWCKKPERKIKLENREIDIIKYTSSSIYEIINNDILENKVIYEDNNFTLKDIQLKKYTLIVNKKM